MSHRSSTNNIFFLSRQCYLTIRQKPHNVVKKKQLYGTGSIWEESFSSACQKIPLVLCKPKVYYPIYNSSPLLLILVHKNSVHIIIIIFLHSGLTSHFHLRLGFPSGLFASGFPANNVHGFSPSAIHPTRPAPLNHLHLINQIIYDEQYKWWSLSLSNSVQSPATSVLLDPNNILLSYTIILFCFLILKRLRFTPI